MPLTHISNELQEKAKNELNEVPNKALESLENIRKWLAEQPHLNYNTDEQWLINFLRVSKHNVEKAKRRIAFFYTCKTRIPVLFSNRDPFLPEIQEILSRRIITVLPETAEPAGPRIIFMRSKLTHPDFFSAKSFIKAAFMVFHILCIEDPNFSIAGLCLIVDLQDMPYRYLTQVTPGLIKDSLTCVQNAYPLRVKTVCYVNTPYFFTIIYNLAKPFLSEKIKKRVHLFGNLEDCYSIVPRSVFPKDYGGEQPLCDEISGELKLKMESYRDRFLSDEI